MNNTVDTAVTNGLGQIPSFIGTHANEVVIAVLAGAGLAFVTGIIRGVLGRKKA